MMTLMFSLSVVVVKCPQQGHSEWYISPPSKDRNTCLALNHHYSHQPSGESLAWGPEGFSAEKETHGQNLDRTGGRDWQPGESGQCPPHPCRTEPVHGDDQHHPVA